MRDWYDWHDAYDQADSNLSRRLVAVQQCVRRVLDTAPPGPLTVLSMCAGQGRDLLGVLPGHARRDDVTAILVEADPRNADLARLEAAAAGLSGVEVAVADAGQIDVYADRAPADLVMVCGVFGNVPLVDIRRTVECCAALCRSGGAVIWTRHRQPPDLVPDLLDWFSSAGFDTEWVSDPSVGYGVGLARHSSEPKPLPAGTRMFTFTDDRSGGQ